MTVTFIAQTMPARVACISLFNIVTEGEHKHHGAVLLCLSPAQQPHYVPKQCKGMAVAHAIRAIILTYKLFVRDVIYY